MKTCKTLRHLQERLLQTQTHAQTVETTSRRRIQRKTTSEFYIFVLLTH